MSKHVVIVGGGVGGLSASIHLAAKGFRVTLLEKNDRVGGKLNLWEVSHPARPRERPFRFDMGPSLLTLPQVFEDLFRAAGEDLRDHLDLIRLSPISKYIWADGTTFETRSDPAEMEQQVRQLAPGDVDGWRRLAARGKHIWDLSADTFLYHAPEQVMRGNGKFDPKAGLAMLTVPFRIGMFSKFSRLIDRHVRSQRLREVLYQYATYSGASPFRAPATLACIPHAELHFGGWYPRGGMYRLAEVLEQIARKLGVDVRTHCTVARIDATARGDAKRSEVSDVTLDDGTRLPADAVVANCDVVYAYRHLIPAEHRRKYDDRALAKIEPGGSGMVLLLGVEGRYPQLAHHTKFMPADYRSDLVAMFETRTIPTDPCIYVAATTRTDPSQAPDGCENLFVLASAPPLDGRIDWGEAGPRYEAQLVDTLERRFGLTDLSKRIVVRRRITPVELQGMYNANAGSIYGISSNGLRQAFLRPPNRDRDVRGLYFAGGATHPGGGLPLVTLSGKIVSELIAQDLSPAPAV